MKNIVNFQTNILVVPGDSSLCTRRRKLATRSRSRDHALQIVLINFNPHMGTNNFEHLKARRLKGTNKIGYKFGYIITLFLVLRILVHS